MSGNSLRQTVHTHRTSVHQAAKLVAALLRVAGVTAGLAESNGSLPPDLWLTSPVGWLPRTWITSGTLHSVIEYGLPFYCIIAESWLILSLMYVLKHYQFLSSIKKLQTKENRFLFSASRCTPDSSRTYSVAVAWRTASRRFMRRAMQTANRRLRRRRRSVGRISLTFHRRPSAHSFPYYLLSVCCSATSRRSSL